MILQLIKLRFSSWKIITVISIIFLGINYRFALTGHLAAGFSGVALITLISARSAPRSRHVKFEAALPIRARDIFCVSVLGHIGSIWLIFLTSISAIPFSRSNDKPALAIESFEALAVVTLALVLIYSIRVKEIALPNWVRHTVAWTTLTVVNFAFVQFDIGRVPLALTICVFASLILASVILFARTWAAFPESFQIARTEAAKPKSTWNIFRLPSTPFLPVFRALFSKGAGQIPAVSPLVAFGFGFLGVPFAAILFMCLSIVGTIMRVRQSNKWLLSLPISRQTLFLPIALGPLVSFTLGSVGHFMFWKQTPRETIVDWMVVSGLALLGVASVEIPSLLRQHIRPRNAYLLAGFAITGFCYILWRWFLHVVHGNYNMVGNMPADVWLSAILPPRMPLLIVTAIALVAAPYWLAYKGFSRADAMRTPATPGSQ